MAEDVFTYDATESYTLPDIMAAQVFRNQHIQKLPIRTTETTPRLLTEIPVLSILGKVLTLGTDSG